MAGNQVTGDGLSMNIAGMSKNQLYDIMSQMKTLIEQNQDQARQILIQNPLLTKALFQAQIMLGMLQPPQEIPNIQPTGAHHSQPAAPPLQPPAPPPRDQTSAPTQQNQPTLSTPSSSSSSISPSNPSLPPLQPPQHGRGPVKAQAALSPHYSTQPPPPMPPASTPLQQQPLHISNMAHLPLQPPLPSQPRPPSMSAFPHQNYSHMGPNAGFQHSGPPQHHHSQPMFHSSSRPPTSIGPPFSQGQALPPNPQLSQGLYQGGGSHGGMEFNQMGIPSQQPERGSNWMPGLSENAVGPTPSPFLPAPHMTSSSQPPRPASLTADMEKALLQQVMSLTPDQINLLPPEQRNQVLQLQQMLRQ